MKQLLLSLLLLLPIVASAGKPEDPAKYQDIKKVMNDVKAKYASLKHRHIRIIVNYQDANRTGWNAQAGDNEIILTYFMAQEFKRNHDVAAYVFGHELSHIVHGDYADNKEFELRADKEGVYKANAAGYDGCRGAKEMLKYLEDVQGYNTPEPTHGSVKERIENLPCGKGR